MRHHHRFNHDAVCIDCSFDGADWAWQRLMADKDTRLAMRQPSCSKPDRTYATQCECGAWETRTHPPPCNVPNFAYDIDYINNDTCT